MPSDRGAQWTLMLLLAAALGVDWLFPLRGALSFGLAATSSLLARRWSARCCSACPSLRAA